MPSHQDDRGQIAPLLALLVVAIGLGCFGLALFGRSAVDFARARTAADAAGLAGAAGGEDAARRLASENGGTLQQFETAGGDVRVRVAVGGSRPVSARARAELPQSDAPAAPVTGLAPGLRAAIARAEQLTGRRLPITSGFRTPAQQARLWFGRVDNRYPGAPPGASMHQRGLAIDVAAAFAEELAAIGPGAGLCRPYPRTDPVHFELCERRLSREGGG